MEHFLPISTEYLFCISSILLLVSYVFVISLALKVTMDRGKNFNSSYVVVEAVLALVVIFFVMPYHANVYSSISAAIIFSVIFAGLAIFCAIGVVATNDVAVEERFTIISIRFTAMSLVLTTFAWVESFV